MEANRQKRFAQNVKDNDMRGIGGSAFKQKGYSYPTHEEMNQFKKYNLPFDIDQQLRKTIIALNQSGYRTWGSCSGHVDGERGFITVAPHPSDPFFITLKKENPVFYQSLFLHYKLNGGYSKVPANPNQIKSIIKRYTGITQIYYKPPIYRPNNNRTQLYHAFTFPSQSDQWG
jgi:hypothetical protein